MIEMLLCAVHELNKLNLTYKLTGDEEELYIVIRTTKNEYIIKLDSYDYSLYLNGKHLDTSKTIDKIIKLI